MLTDCFVRHAFQILLIISLLSAFFHPLFTWFYDTYKSYSRIFSDAAVCFVSLESSPDQSGFVWFEWSTIYGIGAATSYCCTVL